MKPAGLDDPRTGRWAYAIVQLRQENQRADSYNLVGFQNHMRFADQARVFRMIPGLEAAEFVRFGQMHRNTYINSPALLRPTLQLIKDERILFAGQISGVEGYAESIATGLMAGRHAAALVKSEPLREFPRETALGSLCHYITHADPAHFQPRATLLLIFYPLLMSRPSVSSNMIRKPVMRKCALAPLWPSTNSQHVLT